MKRVRTVLITGATGGIGQALCCQFARQGYQLIITGRNPSRLRGLAHRLSATYGIRVRTIGMDLGIKGAARELCARLEQMGAVVDVLVNNAGFGLAGLFVENSIQQQQEMLYVNIHAVTELCRRLLPGMIERGWGRILNVASIGSFVPGPYNGVYCASKAYVLSLSRALAQECRGTGVKVTALCPGATHTGFAHRAGMERTLLFRVGVMHPAQVAAKGYRGLMAGRPVVIPGLQNKAACLLSRIAPQKLVTLSSGAIQMPQWMKEGKDSPRQREDASYHG
ncbi:MAG: SDR family NAD(P)-dependent oxidoreductase [Oscillospiraceae bacterium]